TLLATRSASASRMSRLSWKYWYTVAREARAPRAMSAIEVSWKPLREMTSRATSRISSRRAPARGESTCTRRVASPRTDMSVSRWCRDDLCIALRGTQRAATLSTDMSVSPRCRVVNRKFQRISEDAPPLSALELGGPGRNSSPIQVGGNGLFTAEDTEGAEKMEAWDRRRRSPHRCRLARMP